MPEERLWKVTKTAIECTISGVKVDLPKLPEDKLEVIKKVTREQDATQLSKALRIQLGTEKLYARKYKRMKKRISYVALTKTVQMLVMKYFIYCKKSHAVFAVANLLVVDPECFIFSQAGLQILKVVQTNSIAVTPVCDIKKLFFVSIPVGLKFCN